MGVGRLTGKTMGRTTGSIGYPPAGWWEMREVLQLGMCITLISVATVHTACLVAGCSTAQPTTLGFQIRPLFFAASTNRAGSLFTLNNDFCDVCKI